MATIKNLHLLNIFCKVAELGSFTKAAKALNSPKSRVSRSISTLEEELGVQLIRRTTRQINLTTSGEDFFTKVSPLINKINSEIDSIKGSKDEMSGVIKITAPEDMAQTILSDIISRYVRKYPNMEVQSVITNDFLDLGKEKIDLALRVGKLEDSNLIQSKLTEVTLVLIATKTYLAKFGTPKEFSDLSDHRFLSFKKLNPEFLNFNKGFKIKTVATSDSFSMLLNLALNNEGISILPDYYCKKYLESGELVRVLTKWKGRKSTVHMVYSPTKSLPLKVREFINIAKEISI